MDENLANVYEQLNQLINYIRYIYIYMVDALLSQDIRQDTLLYTIGCCQLCKLHFHQKIDHVTPLQI